MAEGLTRNKKATNNRFFSDDKSNHADDAMPKRVALSEISEHLGLAKSTVSLVLNNKPVRCTPETRQRIKAAAAKLGYRSNMLARALRKGRTQIIGLVAGGLQVEPTARKLQAVEQAATAKGYRVISCFHHGSCA